MNKPNENADDLITCCLCNEKIQPTINGWKFGNNPAPLGETEDDRCCDMCNATKVIPARLEAVMRNRKN